MLRVPRHFRHASFAQLAPGSDCAGGDGGRGGSTVFRPAESTREAERFNRVEIRRIPGFTGALTLSLVLSFAVNTAKKTPREKVHARTRKKDSRSRE